jgi:hypothetical protein
MLALRAVPLSVWDSAGGWGEGSANLATGRHTHGSRVLPGDPGTAGAAERSIGRC